MFLPLGSTGRRKEVVYGASRVWLWIASLVVVAAPVAAQDAYPNRPVRWIRAISGRWTDRHSVAHLRRQAGRAVEPKRRSREQGRRIRARSAATFAAKSAPDGYTLILGTQSTHGSNLIFFPNLPYDPIKDFQPLALIGTACMALVTAPSVPANTPKELVEWIRKQDGGRELCLGGTGQLPARRRRASGQAGRHQGDARALSRQFGGHA